MSKKMALSGLIVGLVVLVASVAGAQDQGGRNARAGARPSARPQMAQGAPAEVRGLADMVGTWEGTGTMRMGTQSANVRFRWVCEVASGGYAVRCGLSMTGVPGMASYEESDLMGWNPNDRLYHWYSVTNAGEVHDHAGSCDGTTTTFLYQGVVDGKLFVERISFVMQNNQLRLRATTSEGATETSVLEGSATRH